MATRHDRLSAWLRRNARSIFEIEISILDIENKPTTVIVIDHSRIEETKIGDELSDFILAECQANCDLQEGPSRYQVSAFNAEKKMIATFVLKLEPSEGPNDPLDIGLSSANSAGTQLIRTIEAMIRMTVSMHLAQQRAFSQIVQEQRREITELRSRERDIQSTAHRLLTEQIADIREDERPNPALEKLVALGEKLVPAIVKNIGQPEE